MAKQNIDIGVEGNDATGDSIRESFRKVNENFTELYAVFGIEGQISLVDLSDVPNTYENNEGKVVVVRQDATGVDFSELASDSALDPTAVDTIGFDFSQTGKVVIRQLSIDISTDPSPTLGGPLNAGSQVIGNIGSITQESVDVYNSVYGTTISTDDLVIDKKFADSNYQPRQQPGSGIRLDDEPADTSQYIVTVESFDLGNITATSHGLSGAFTGAPFRFDTTGTPPTNVIDGDVYYVRVVDSNTISLHENQDGAINNVDRVVMSGGTGTATITDTAYDPDLAGNWLSSVAIPRKSITRRQGDTMEGALYLHDHPGDLSGLGTSIGGKEDLQAATKLYVDRGTPISQVNLYVSMSGDDKQTYTPAGKEGRSASWAYRTINAAARKAEELQIAAPFEIGPYKQTATYGEGEADSNIISSGITAPVSGRNNVRTLIIQNYDFFTAEIEAFLATEFPDLEYDVSLCLRDVRLMLDAVSLDVQTGNNANYLSRYAGLRYYASPSARKAIGEQGTETLAAINHLKNMVTDVLLNREIGTDPAALVGTKYQTRYDQYINALEAPDAQADEAVEAKFDVILDVIRDGPLSAPSIVDGTSRYKLIVDNGNYGFLDQGNPANKDIIPGKVVIGKNSGAVGEIVTYNYESDPDTVTQAGADEFELQLLEPVEFENGEEIEFGNIVRENQISIRVESGIYEEDYPIRVPTQVSVKGDEFRRVIVRPKQRVSQSRWANTFFYRDVDFDGLTIVRSGIVEFQVVNGQIDATRATVADDYTNVGQVSTDGVGENAKFDITVRTNGAITATLVDKGTGYRVNDIITIADSVLGASGADPVQIKVTKIEGGKEYVNPLTGNIDGYFGYHYLTNPDKLPNTGPGYANLGGFETAKNILLDNKEFFQEQVTKFVDTEYPAVVYNNSKCYRDVGLIVEALAKDLEFGGNEFALEAQGEYYLGALPKNGSQNEATEAAIDYIYTIAAKLFASEQPDTIYGVGLDYPTADLFNGDAEDGAVDVLFQLVNTITFAFDPDFNPPLRNDEMDCFLMNDASLLRNMTVQGHGGFMLVLDPEGQVLTKSPYIQTGSSFSKSVNKQTFSGGLFVDAFAGNTALKVTARRGGDPFVLEVKSFGSQADPQGLFVRRPETPAPFYIDGRRFQVNAVTEYDPDLGTAVLLLDRSSNDGNGFTGRTSNLVTGVDLDTLGDFEYNRVKCERDTGYIVDALSYDGALGTNYNSVTNGIRYTMANAGVVTGDQLSQTTQAYNFLRDAILDIDNVIASPTMGTAVTDGVAEINDIITNGLVAADALTFTVPSVLPTAGAEKAHDLLVANRGFIIAEITAYINANYPSLTYDITSCERDVGLIVDALCYDILYGSNTGTLINARSYFVDGVADQLGQDEEEPTIDAYGRLADVVEAIVLENAVTKSGSFPESQTTLGLPASATEGNEVNALVTVIKDAIDGRSLGGLPVEITPDLDALGVSAGLRDAWDSIATQKDLLVHNTSESITAVIPITMQTAGNRSILGNDFTQINDLGYGLIAANSALSEMVSMFTYYCQASYYSKNGSEIRSLTGSSCYGEYGLVAEGSDPNEIPDGVVLQDDMAQPAKIFTADVILYTADEISVSAGETLTQATTGATGVVTMSTVSRFVYLTDTTGGFDTVNQITGSVSGALGAASIPDTVDATGYTNNEEQLSAYAYDFKRIPSNRGEFDVYHPLPKDIFARYEISNIELLDHIMGSFVDVGGTNYATTSTTSALGTGATFTVTKTVTDGYTVVGELAGQDYEVGDTITFTGQYFGGASPANDIVVEVQEVNSIGSITDFTYTGTIAVTEDTPVFSGKIFKLNFSTSDGQYSQDGLLGDLDHGTFIQQRYNQTFIFEDIARPDILTIRPSTAVIFSESPGTVYRSISFLSADAVGDALLNTESLAGFDSTYDYIRLIVDSAKAQETIGSVYDTDGITALTGGTTKGDTAGDIRIAVDRIYEENEVKRLNNNTLTEARFRPSDYTDVGAQLPMITSWGGKKHQVFNYRGVKAQDVTVNVTGATRANPVVVTFDSNINMVNGEIITFADVEGMTDLNGNSYYVNNVTANTAELYTNVALTVTLDGTAFGTYTTGGTGAIEREILQLTPSETDDYGLINIADVEDINYPATATGLASTTVLGNEVVVLRTGLPEGSPATVTINISTCRATGHDFLDVGTGGFNTSNYPNVIYGLPRAPDQAREVDERGKGRVFYVSTDQNGIFRVGRFFSVDQGTGTVSFSASIALSDVDGLGFKRGVVVTEFSTDTAMTDNASDTVPTESAVRGYVNRRLGFDQNGATVSNPIGDGALSPTGSVPLSGDLQAAGNTITNLRAPTSDTDAATKLYVDAQVGGLDTIPDFRDTEINDYAEDQLLVSTGQKRIILDADTIVSGPYYIGDTITGSISGAEGTVVDVQSAVGIEGNIIILTYEPVSGTFSSGPPVGADTVEVLGGAEALAVDGPVDEWANGVWSADADLEFTATKIVTDDGAPNPSPVSRYVELDMQIKPDTIINADVKSDAAIAQSKLNMNAATTRANATGITQADLGLASFDNTNFDASSGWISIKANGITLGDIQQISTGQVLGNNSGIVGDVAQLSFNTVVDGGGGILHTDIPDSDTGAVVRTGAETYDITAISTTGSPNSIVKTDANGSIQVNSLILGGDSNYEILALDTTELIFKTPAQGTILTASGGSEAVGTPGNPGYVAPTYPDLTIPGSIDIGGTGVTESTLQGVSNFNGESNLGVDWIYSSFIEAPGEKGAASTGVAIGANTGKTTAGQVGIVVADTVTSSSVVPAVYSRTGMVPDTNNVYNIGSNSLRYNTVYATVFNGTATEAYYADLAENYLGDAQYEPGTVLVFGGDEEVTVGSAKGDTRVAGVVTTNPAHLMNSHLKGDNVVGVALQGRVPCKVIGKVQKGDMLVSSAVPGYAIVDNNAKVGTVIGKALANKNDGDKGVIEVVVGRV